MTIQNTDQYVVESNGTDFSVESQDVDQKVQDDDLFVVCRSGTPYKATYAEVKESMVVPTPPVVQTVSLIEADPEGDRFTSQSFVASSQVFDGEPISTKTIDAHVDGTISRQVKFDEPLESSGTITAPDYLATTSFTDGAATLVLAEKEKFFDGNIDTYTTSLASTWTLGPGAIEIDLSSAPITDVKEVIFTTNKAQMDTGYVEMFLTYNSTDQGSVTSFPRVDTGTHYITTFTPGNAPLTQISLRFNLAAAWGSAWELSSGIQIVKNDGTVEWITNGAASTTLTFANGTNMEGLAGGDTVSQINNFTEPLENSTATQEPNYTNDLNNTVSYAYSSPGFNFGINQAGWDLGFDGDPNTGLAFFTGQYQNSISWELYDYTFPNPFTGSPKVEVKWVINFGNNEVVTLRVNGNNQTTGDLSTWYNNGSPPDNGWYDISDNIAAAGGSFTSLGAYVETTNQPGRNTYWVAIRINGVILQNDAINVDLTFANGTDMSALAAGDDVSQPGAPVNWYSDSTITEGVTIGYSYNMSPASAMFDGNLSTSPIKSGLIAQNQTCGYYWTPPIPIPNVTKLEIIVTNGLSPSTRIVFGGNKSSINTQVGANTWFDVTDYMLEKFPNGTLEGMGWEFRASDFDVVDCVGIAAVRVNGVILTDGAALPTTGTVGSITGTTASLSSSSGAWINGEDVTTGDKTTTGTVSDVADTTATLSSSSGAWVNGLKVIGPQKTIVDANARLYCVFDSNGNITDLQNDPQDPPYTTQNSNPGLTLTFPATFPSGQTPDDELSDGTTLTVDVSAANGSGTSGPVSATVQPEPEEPDVPLAGLTTLYNGSNASRTITNGIDLANNGGLVWSKARNSTSPNVLMDTVRGTEFWMSSNMNDGDIDNDGNSRISSFNTDGYSLGANTSVNGDPSTTYVSWTFGKAAGYFDVIKQTLTASPAVINHSLGTAPGLIIGKNIDTNSDWICSFNGFADNEYLILSSNLDKQTSSVSVYYDKSDTSFNYNPGGPAGAGEYVFYVFAADTPGVIKCGSYIGNGSTTGPTITTGFEPQWVLIKSSTRISSSANWCIFDNKRGFSSGLGVNDGKLLYANVPNAEVDDKTIIALDNGFQIADNGGTINDAGETYIYVAIAAPPDARSQTTAELAETKLKFATFENRSMVKCGNDAEAKRDDLIIALEAQGYSLSDILNYL